MTADFHRFYGRSLATVREWGIPLSEVAAMAAYLPPDSATRRALDPHWQRTPEIDLLREIEHDLQVLAWQKTQDGAKGRNVPERIPLPWDAPPEGAMRGDRMTLDEIDAWLGWDQLKQEA